MLEGIQTSGLNQFRVQVRHNGYHLGRCAIGWLNNA
jgi:hypothetical protein